ncbi:response regulator transcription factor [Enterococcus sp. PF-2]|jgi:DNA-binding NarL/FixJ family response regulator|uniref:response regulator transcription factor n=1 Tax=Enterococcus TaxID=1350 RepID=UPI000A34EAF9|nr:MULTISPECIES: response regulator transcription factor [Enterococcus]AUJ85133.1 DNA-binding response regulator [Enterococcus sp. CR-Ec1]MBO1122000.1 response regulator transcription factor [Enterococcus casseliflavus]OTO24250.1 LuxR family DNA-binding response regulator [Enterococcus sp. 3C8_DIV0646]OTO27376.1 LuxR family DNA-binding response regulator [Enterococcus sp. 3C7_DIV0644]TPE03709.1 response regulator transcription factor [Enterococcus sp. PF-3]
MITVVIIDDDPFVTTSLQTILESTEEIRVLGIGHCAKDAIDLYETHRPDVLLTDIRMPEQTGIDAAKEILAKFPHAILLLLTTFKDEEYIREAFSIGVKGYLIKQNLQAIIPSVKASYNGQVVFGNEIVETFTQLMKNEPSIDNQTSFSEREFAIIKEVAAGKNNKEIADALYLSDGTVRNYISQLLEKLGLRDRTQLAIYFYHHLQ